MSNDNVRLALIISGIWGGIIIVIVGIEAIVHDGEVAVSIVDTFSKVLFGLAGILGTITGLGKLFDAKILTNPTASAAASSVASAALSASSPSDPTNDTAGAGAVAVVGENT